MNRLFKYISFAMLGSVLLYSCQKNNLVIDQDVVPPAFAKFNTILPGDTSYAYYITNNSAPVKLPIGVSSVSNQDRTINLTYTSPTGASQGVQFNAPATITIPAGQAVDTIEVQGLLSGYTSSSRIDTLFIKVGGGDVPANSYKSTYRLILRKYCDVVPDDFLGDYNNTNELWGTSDYGPYTTTISSITPISSTKATIVVENIFDFGWNPIKFELDWANPADFKVTVISQNAGIADAGTIDSDYAGYEVMVRPFSGRTGTFSSCEQTITLRMQLGVAGLGWFGDLYQVSMVR